MDQQEKIAIDVIKNIAIDSSRVLAERQRRHRRPNPFSEAGAAGA